MTEYPARAEEVEALTALVNVARERMDRARTYLTHVENIARAGDLQWDREKTAYEALAKALQGITEVDEWVASKEESWNKSGLWVNHAES